MINGLLTHNILSTYEVNVSIHNQITSLFWKSYDSKQ